MSYIQNKSLKKKKHNNKYHNNKYRDDKHHNKLTKKHYNKTKKKNNHKYNNDKHLPEWMIDKGITKHIYEHEKHKSYKSILQPLLIWEEIETEIINNYSIPKKYDKLNSNKNMDKHLELDKLVNDQFKNYKTMNKKDLIQTLKFLFNNFKEFLFFSIRDGKIKSYYVYNKDFKNTWSKDLRFVEENGQINENFNEYYERYLKSTGKHQVDNPVLSKEKWYINNCILATNDWKEMPTSYVSQIQNMLDELVKMYDVPDCDLIINRKDFPILNLDKSPAHNSVYSSDKIMTEQPDNPWTIFSQNKTKNNYDICIPTADEWNFVNELSKKKVNHNWNTKKSIGVFRGGATGCSTNIDINPRFRLSKISNEWNDQTNAKSKDKHELIDVGIVVGNTKNKLTTKMKINNQLVMYLSKSPIILNKRLEYDEQSNYKYVFYIEGNASAYRLSSMFYMKSTVLYIDTKYYQWFEPLLNKSKNVQHMIKIKENFDEKTIFKEIKKLKENDKKAQEIALNGYDFFEKYINKETILHYWIRLLIKTNELQTN
jgi:hypothetical protein